MRWNTVKKRLQLNCEWIMYMDLHVSLFNILLIWDSVVSLLKISHLTLKKKLQCITNAGHLMDT